MDSTLPPILVVMGLTASGKTRVAIELAKALNGEVISVDSALVYQTMDIGTAKPSLEEQQGVPHHLIDIRDPSQPYSAAEFQKDALASINAIHSSGKLPILAGGTMLYFKALLEGLSQMPPANVEVREMLQHQLETEGAHALHARLQACDGESAKRIHPNDPQRLLRALEVFELTGTSLTQWHKDNKKQPQIDYPHVKLALLPSCREQHRQLVAQRFNQMLSHGFMEEVQALHSRGDLTANLPSIRSVGYRQAWQYLDDEYDFATMTEKAITATRQLAKRQMTWLRKEPNLTTFDALNLNDSEVIEHVKHALMH